MYKRGAGVVLTLAAGFAAVHFSGGPGGTQAGMDGGSAAYPSSQRPPQAVTAPQFSGGCTAYNVAVPSNAAIHDQNLGAAKGVLDNFFASDTPHGPSKAMPATVRYAIALAPDPRHTNLSLMYDREISLVQQAAQDSGYVYNSSWFPWRVEEEQSFDSLADRQVAAKLQDGREACPGLILFRKSQKAGLELGAGSGSGPGSGAGSTNGGGSNGAGASYENALLVFVVGEQPTGGVNEDQWANAVRWLGKYAKPGGGGQVGDGVLRVLGPTFTGTLASMERDLSAIYTDPGGAAKGKFPSVRLLSGSVTGCSSIQWFERQIHSLPEFKDASSPAPSRIQFGSFQENDDLHTYRFLKFLRNEEISRRHGLGWLGYVEHSGPESTAILSEDETAYADAYAPPDQTGIPPKVDLCSFPYAQEDRPVHLVYPRDISALRNAYQKQSMFDAGSDPRRSAHAILRDESDAKGQNEVTDTVAIYSRHEAAIAQEAYLYGLVDYLRSHHTRYLILRCSNPLDFLFLTQFFHRAYPEARVVTIGSDLLFRREIDTTEFRGVLALTSYPLIGRGQHWTSITDAAMDRLPHQHRVFEGHLLEGIYLASRYLFYHEPMNTPLLIHDAGAPDPLTGFWQPIQIDRAFQSPDYADPYWFDRAGVQPASTHPPTWLAAVGRNGYWPVATLKDDAPDCTRMEFKDGEEREKGKCKAGVQAGVRSTMVELTNGLEQHYELKNSGHDSPVGKDRREFRSTVLLGFPLAWLICGLLSLLLIFYQCWGLMMTLTTPSNGLFSVFRDTTSCSQALLMGMLCSLSVMPMLELCGPGFIPGVYGCLGSSGRFQFCAAVWLAFAAYALMLGFLLLKWVNAKGWRVGFRSHWFWTIVGLAGSGGLLQVVYRSAFYVDERASTAIPVFYRMVHLTDGVSPLLPVLLLTLGFYLWCWQAMAGNLMLVSGRPELPKAGSGPGPVLPRRLQQAQARISGALGDKISTLAKPLFFNGKLLAVPIFMLFCGLVFMYVDKDLPLFSMEGAGFNWVMNGLLALGFLLTAGEAARMFLTWIMLRKLLQALGRMPLRRTICALRPVDAQSLWSVSGNVQRIQYRLFQQQIDAARRLELCDPGYFGFLGQAIASGTTFTMLSEADVEAGVEWNKDLPFWGTAKMRESLADAVGEVINLLLIDAWRGERDSLSLDDGVGAPDKGDAGKADGAGQALPQSRWPDVRAAEEFVSFHYIAFIQNIVARIRTMALSMVFLFVSVCFAISFYPFVPRTDITVWMVLNLVLIGFAVAYVYASMERDEIMSYISNSRPGQLGGEFYVKLFGFLAGPVIGILTTQFPAITDSVLGWLQPGLDAVK